MSRLAYELDLDAPDIAFVALEKHSLYQARKRMKQKHQHIVNSGGDMLSG
jgi:hypothetical protein